MAKEAIIEGSRRGLPWRIIGWGMAGGLLLLPAIAMQFTNEVNWDETDFIFAAIIFGTVGGLFELAVRMSSNLAYRAAIAASLAASFMIVWSNLAVGMIGNEDNSYNLLFFGVIGISLVGGALVRFRASGMAVVTIVAALAQVAVAFGGLSVDQRGAIFSTVLASLWLLSALLFRWAARGQARAEA